MASNKQLSGKLLRFIGSIEAKTDSKGRAFLPVVFRKALQVSGEETLIMRKDVFQHCLVLYPLSVWNGMVDNLHSRLNRWNKRDQQIFRQFVSNLVSITLDGNGRFLIPRAYLEWARIDDQQIRFIGMDDCIEIWSQGNDEAEMTPDDFSQALEEVMTDL
ncbi:transcriptional regulator MraZ [Prevotella lacticifex]|uniref:Transcriptional regulator MraZ n=1 Tax=Prevotella lacticifex TaxID=2854755 RepID=A0A9R1CXW5_9BACT|nr:transcriptional regulator MraZ [Prevotella lacticifex]GJG40067.1 transcriptional regulator MraZ [Prevotella lacticifex]GJG41252.1 transcriptional regulator MraZ [Prevotella lacticifex]GJG46420.1 transcriptional regulator MraZ [Prevotella lacticifex]GJG47605.1 transcriptional regulator MraZ [Prevotella lacticifex]